MPGTLLPATARQLQAQAESPAAAAAAEAGGVLGFQGVWAAGTNYGNGASVTGSDAHVYISKVANNLAHNPVGDAGVHWQAAAA